MRVLLLEDHRRLAEFITAGLKSAGLGVDWFATGGEGAAAAQSIAYDAMILDLGLPDGDGLDVLRELRARVNPVPVLILTARDGIEDRVAGLDLGADDYLVKPFAMTELAARLRALLRRPGAPLGLALSIGNVTLHTVERTLTIDGLPHAVSPREFEVLELLMRRAGQVVPKRLIEDKVYGMGDEVLPNAVEALIYRLRKRLQQTPARLNIHTMRGVGYMLAE